MSPIDGLKRNDDRKKRIYRSQNRVNFLSEQPKQPAEKINHQTIERPKLKRLAITKIILIAAVIFLITGAMYLSEKMFSPSGGSSLTKFNPFAQLAHLVTAEDKRVDGELSDRVNILALGIGGEGHDGPYLTDTIIVISVKPSTGEIGMVSIPRDMIVKLRDDQWYKINQVYSIGVVNNPDDPEKAPDYIVQAIEDTLDIPIHYYGIVTFQGFEEFIDEIGGITIDVPTGFTDNQYPVDEKGNVTTVSFTTGTQLMDGPTALIYARSRHGDNYEGSDFARSRRQQLILQAVKDKVFKFSTLLSPTKLSAIFDLLGNSVRTNMSIWQAIKIVNMVKETDAEKIYKITLDDAPDSILEPGFTEEGAWILQPKDGNFDTLARQFDDIFNTGKIKEEAAQIEVLNGTVTGGLAYWTSVFLEKLNYQIFSYGNAPTQDYQRTVIYDLSDGEKKQTLKSLKQELGAYVSKPTPDYLTAKYENIDHPDIIAILGIDYAEKFKLPEPEEDSATSTATSTDEIIEE